MTTRAAATAAAGISPGRARGGSGPSFLGARLGKREGWENLMGRRHVRAIYALGGWTVGLQHVADGSTRVWFFRMLLGAFVPGRDTTIQPCAVDAAPDDVAMTNSAADPHTTRAA